jgi:hypothetical protein
MLKKYKSKAFISSLLYLTAAYQSPAQLTGQFSLGGEQAAAPNGAAQPSAAAATNQKQITVVGLGLTPEAAEKQAITDAVRQAVGAFIDSNTIVQNEEVIKDRILSVSSGFVKEYKPAAPARKREDGLFEITIVATVESSKVVQALKEQNLISGEVAGQNLWAESSTKVMNAQDGVAMLEAKIPEFIKNSVTITPLGKDGKPQFVKDASGNEVPSTAPVAKSDDPATGKAKLIWAFEIGLNKKYYTENMLPSLIKCLNAISGESPKVSENQIKTRDGTLSFENFRNAKVIRGVSSYNFFLENPHGLKYDKVRVLESGQLTKVGLTLISHVSRNLDSVRVYQYNCKFQNKLEIKAQGQQGSSFSVFEDLCHLKLQLNDSEGETIATQSVVAWQPFTFTRDYFVIGPFLKMFEYDLFTPIPTFVEIEMPIELLKEIKQVKVSLEVPDIKVSLKSANDR